MRKVILLPLLLIYSVSWGQRFLLNESKLPIDLDPPFRIFGKPENPAHREFRIETDSTLYYEIWVYAYKPRRRHKRPYAWVIIYDRQGRFSSKTKVSRRKEMALYRKRRN